MNTKISVITPLYQGEAHIAQCMQSVIDQSRSDIEHIVIDNNSTDAGPEIVQEYARNHPHIHLLHNPVPGSGPTRNVGIKAAQGRYIAFLDSDDWWDPRKCDVQIEAMEQDRLAFSWTSYTLVDATGTTIRKQRSPKVMTASRHLMKRGTIGCLTAVYDSHMLGKCYMNDMGLRQDFCLWYDIFSKCELWGMETGGVPDTLAYYRVHDSGISADKKKASRMQWQAYREHVGLGIPQASLCFASYAANGILDRLRR
jgi:teichuronic acid biosynthesis glycosyltransferase TuaG